MRRPQMPRSTSKVRSPGRCKVRMGSAIVPGVVVPDYELANHHGTHGTLSELQYR